LQQRVGALQHSQIGCPALETEAPKLLLIVYTHGVTIKVFLYQSLCVWKIKLCWFHWFLTWLKIHFKVKIMNGFVAKVNSFL